MNRANFITVAALVGLLALVSLTAPRWARLLRRPLPGAESTPAETTPTGALPQPEPSKEAARTINVKLFFQASDRPGMLMEDREVAYSADLGTQAKLILEELVRGPKGETVLPTLDPATKVLEVFVSARGDAFASLSKEVAGSKLGGTEAEMITVFSVIDSLAANLPGIKRVQILIDDRPAATLAGHVDISRPLRSDMTLLATQTLTPVEPAAASSPVT